MKRLLVAGLAVAAVLAGLHAAAPADAAVEEFREPYATHALMSNGETAYYVDPDKQADEKVLKVWIGEHRARRVNGHRWVHLHPTVEDGWLHVEIRTTERRWSAWMNFDRPDSP